jgi:hypothetical protein
MWDQAPDCGGVVLAWDNRDMHTYIYAPSTVKGPLVAKLGPVEIGSHGEITVTPLAMPLPPNCTPIVSHYGDVTCQVLQILPSTYYYVVMFLFFTATSLCKVLQVHATVLDILFRMTFLFLR